MIYFINDNKNPYFNLALEEVLIKDETINDEILLLWQNDRTVVIGKNQNTIEEVNNEFVKSHNINIVRRLSGGGAVYHDLGNLNFTFIFNKNKDNVRNYQLFTKPIIDVLKQLGLNAEFSGKNDILIDDKKISGNAQYIFNNRILHHGTILFNVDMTILPKVLKPDLLKLQSKGIKSVKSRVTNILPLLGNKLLISEFQQLIISNLTKNKSTQIKKLDQEIINKVELLVKEKYSTWEWNYGSSPEYNLELKSRLENKGTIDVKLKIVSGVIVAIKIYGDFLGSFGTEILENKLLNQKYNTETISKIIADLDVKSIFGYNFTNQDVLSAIIK